METLTVPVKKREGVGTRSTIALRSEGFIPAVIYGQGGESVAIALPLEIVQDCLKRNIRILTLDLAGTQDAAMIKDLQWDSLGDHLLHVDFLRVRMDEEVSMSISLVPTGRAKGIEEGGILDISRNEITVKCLPTQIPDAIEFDVSDLAVGDSLSINDIVLPEGVTLDDDPDQNVASITARVEVEEEAPAEGEEGEEGEAAEGDAPAEGDGETKDDKGDG